MLTVQSSFQSCDAISELSTIFKISRLRSKNNNLKSENEN